MRDDGDRRVAAQREPPRGRGAEAVARRADPGDALGLERGDDGVRVCRLAEVGKGKTAELARLVEVVIERVRGRN